MIIQLVVLFLFAIAAVLLAVAAVYEWIVKPWSAGLKCDWANESERLRIEVLAEIRVLVQSLEQQRLSGPHGPSPDHDERIRRSRVQMDVEFAALQGAWSRLTDARQRIVELHTLIADPSQSPESSERWFLEKAEAFRHSFAELETFVGAQEPFLPAGVLQPLRRLLAIGREEADQVHGPGVRLGSGGSEQLSAGMRRRAKFVDVGQETGTAIREYLSRVVVIE